MILSPTCFSSVALALVGAITLPLRVHRGHFRSGAPLQTGSHVTSCSFTRGILREIADTRGGESSSSSVGAPLLCSYMYWPVVGITLGYGSSSSPYFGWKEWLYLLLSCRTPERLRSEGKCCSSGCELIYDETFAVLLSLRRLDSSSHQRWHFILLLLDEWFKLCRKLVFPEAVST